MKRATSVLAAAVLGLGLAAVPSTAHAYACHGGTYLSNGAYVYCTGTSSRYQATVSCRYYISATGTYAYDTEYGLIQSGGNTSYVYCLTGWSRYAVGYRLGV